MANTKIPVELSSTPSIVDDGDATAITITSAEKVGVGTANPSQLLTVESNSFPILQISNTLNNNPADGVALDMVEKQDGYAASTATFGQTGVYGYRLKLNGSTNELILQSGSQTTTNDRVTVERDTGNVTLNTGNLVIGTAGKGIDFSSTGEGTTTGANMANELFDDYEEGSWTPTLGAGGTITVNTATYTKVGRYVHAYCYVHISPPNNGTMFSIYGLPYNAVNNSNLYPPGSLGYSQAKDLSMLHQPLVHYNNNYIYFHYSDGTSSGQVPNSQMHTGSSYGLILNVHYEV